MDGGIEQPLPSALRRLPIAWVLLYVRNESRVEDCFAIVPGIQATIQIEIRTVDLQIGESGHALQRVQSLWQEHRIYFIDWCDRKRRQYKAVVFDNRENLSPFRCLWPESQCHRRFFSPPCWCHRHAGH